MAFEEKRLLILDEDLDSVYGTYYSQQMGRDDFDRIIALDPTFKVENNKLGEFGKWLLTLHKRGEDFDEIGDAVKPALERYKSIKNKLKGDNAKYRDVNAFKKFSDLTSFLDTVDVYDKSDFEVRAEQIPGAVMFAKNDDWEVWNPQTYEASKFIRGDNAVWCTGRHDSDHYYNYYTERGGKIFIIINKHDRDNKYQFAIYAPERRFNDFREFKDSGNSGVEPVDFFLRRRSLFNLLKDKPEFVNFESMNRVREYIEFENGDAKLEYNFGDLSYEARKIMGNNGFMKLVKEVVITTEHTGDVVDITQFRGRWQNWPKLRKLTIGNGFVAVAQGMFSDMPNLKAVVIEGNTMKNIGESAFEGCKNLETVNLPESVDTLELNAFDKCEKVKITTKKHPIACKRINQPFYAKHIEFTSGDDIEEALELNEEFSESMPQWLRDFLKKNKDTKEMFNRVNLDLNKMHFYSLDDIPSPASKFTREPYVPIYHLKYSYRYGDETTEMDQIYVPGLNDHEYYYWPSYWNKETFDKYSKRDILANTVDFCYYDSTDESNWSKDKRRGRIEFHTWDDKYGRHPEKGWRLHDEPVEVPGHYDENDKWVETAVKRIQRFANADGYDKSGYLLDPHKYERMRIQLGKFKVKSMDYILDELNGIRKELASYLTKFNVKKINSSPIKIRTLRNLSEQLMQLMEEYTNLVESIENALALKDKKQRKDKLDDIFFGERWSSGSSVLSFRDRIRRLKKSVDSAVQVIIGE